jgi:methyl-accepting chemotaxis protein
MSEGEKAKDKGMYVSLRVKLLIVFTLLYVIVLAGSDVWAYSFASNRAVGQIREDLETTLLAAAQGVDADALAALYAEDSTAEPCAIPTNNGDPTGYYPDDQRFWDHARWLQTVNDIEPRAFLYTYVKGSRPNEMIFIGSNGAVWEPDPAGAKFCERYVADDPEPPYRGLQETTLDMEGYTDDFGRWVSGYTPITNDEGEVIAGLGVDFRADYIEDVRQGIINKMATAFAISSVVLIGLVFIVSNIVTGPVRALTGAATRIGEGDYDQDFETIANTSLPDEITTLTNVFGIMADKVRAREQNLRERVRKLEIMIDEQKRDEQVSEIVDSDFFQDLQARAKEMRERSRKRHSGQKSEADEADE